MILIIHFEKNKEHVNKYSLGYGNDELIKIKSKNKLYSVSSVKQNQKDKKKKKKKTVLFS